jgi:hypothetical protein
VKGYLLDEHVPIALGLHLVRQEPSIELSRVGDGIAPSLSASDPELLRWIEAHDRVLVTNNRSTMPAHLESHLASGGHVPGIVQLPRLVSIAAIVADLVLLWSAASPEEIRDRIIYLPLYREDLT